MNDLVNLKSKNNLTLKIILLKIISIIIVLSNKELNGINFYLFKYYLFLLIFSIKIPFNFKNKFRYKIIYQVDYFVFNIIIHLNFILILSFLNININQLLICYFVFIILFFLINIKYFNYYLKKIKSYFFSLIIIFLTLLVISIDISNLITLGWDAQKFWFYKAINFYDEGNLESLKYLDKGDGYDYPFLGSLIVVYLLENKYN